MATSLLHPLQISAADRLHEMGADRRSAAYLAGELDRHELHVWAALWPEEVPLVNGELPWIAANAE